MRATQTLQNKPWFRWVVAGVLAVCGLWIVLFTARSCEFGRPVARQPDTPMHMKANEMAAKLQEDERFRHVSVYPNPEEPNGLIVSGEIHYGEDLVALDERVKELAAGMPVVIKVEPMDEPPPE